MNLGRKYVLIAVAVIMFALSSVLLVQKSSYADSLSDNLCPDRIEISIGDYQEVYTEDDDNKIDLPPGRYIQKILRGLVLPMIIVYLLRLNSFLTNQFIKHIQIIILMALL